MVVLVKVGHFVVNIYDGDSFQGYVMKISIRITVRVMYETPNDSPRKALRHTYYYHMAESVFAMRLVNLRFVTCKTDQNFKENAHFGALNLFTSEKRLK